jgi:hypothetical protein
MITLKEWMEIVDYRITEGSDYYNCRYGDKIYSLDSWNGEQDGYSFTIIFDTITQKVYEVQAHDYLHNRAYRMIAEGSAPLVGEDTEAWDDTNYIDLEVDDDFVQKALAIKAGEDYDTRVSVPVDFSDEDLLKYMKLAHERDMTFNRFVEEALRGVIEDYKRNPEGMKSKADQWKTGCDIA